MHLQSQQFYELKERFTQVLFRVPLWLPASFKPSAIPILQQLTSVLFQHQEPWILISMFLIQHYRGLMDLVLTRLLPQPQDTGPLPVTLELQAWYITPQAITKKYNRDRHFS